MVTVAAEPSTPRLSRAGSAVERPIPLRLEAPALASLVCLTLVAVPGARGVLGTERSLVPILVATVLMHGVAWVSRRTLGQAGLLAGMAGCSFLLIWIAIPGSTTFGIPWPSSLRTALTSARQALQDIGTGLPPAVGQSATLEDGRLVVALFLVMICALFADQVAFRMRRRLFAVVPSMTLVVLGATRAPSGHRTRDIALYLTAAMTFLWVHHAMTRYAGRSVAGRVRLGGLALQSRAAFSVMALAVAAALLTGPVLPGYGKPPVVARPGSVLALQASGKVSTLVDMRRTLTELSDTVMFGVSSPVATYWRLTSLDAFDGERWTQGPGSGSAPGLVDDDVGGVPTVQSFVIEGLRSEWLPAAYKPIRVAGVGGYLVAGDSSSVRQRKAVRVGDRYEITSLIPQLTESQLSRARRVAPRPRLQRYLALPRDLPRRVTEEARLASARTSDGYSTALALQTYFRRGFSYDLSAQRHDGDALEEFLFRSRRGYCEQFAAAFAVMARSVGLPARVAIGFTQGERQRDGRYQVRGLHAHAWPEVYLEGAGWVAFEPTPGRGMPGAELYTGVVPAQAQSRFEEAPLPTSIPTAGAPGVTTTAVPTTVAPVPTSAVSPSGPATSRPAQDAVAAPDGTGDLSAIPVLAAGCVLVAVASVPLLKARRRRALRRRGSGPNEAVLASWQEAGSALAAVGLGRRPAETLREHADRVVADARLPAPLAVPIRSLAEMAGAAAYGHRPVAPQDSEDAAMAAGTVGAVLRATTPLPRRIGRAVDPRCLWGRP